MSKIVENENGMFWINLFFKVMPYLTHHMVSVHLGESCRKDLNVELTSIPWSFHSVVTQNLCDPSLSVRKGYILVLGSRVELDETLGIHSLLDLDCKIKQCHLGAL